MDDELSVQPKDAIAQPPKPLIPPSISAPRAFVDGAVHLHDQAQGRSEKVGDVPFPEHHLSAERSAGFPSGELDPEPALADGRKLAKRPSPGREDESAVTRERKRTHG
jgi:hypothetical protein